MAKLRELVIQGIPIDGEQEANLRRALPQAAIRTGPLNRSESRGCQYQGPDWEEQLAESSRDPEPIP